MNIPDLKAGDEILVGKWLNRRATIQDFGTDAHGQPTVITDKGEYNVFKFRLAKLMKEESVDKASEMAAAIAQANDVLEVSRDAWFKAVKDVAYQWDRKDANNLVVWVDQSDEHDAEAALMKLGGAVMSKKFDKQAGKTYLIVREPKGLEAPESVGEAGQADELKAEREKLWDKIKVMGKDTPERQKLLAQHTELSKKINALTGHKPAGDSTKTGKVG